MQKMRLRAHEFAVKTRDESLTLVTLTDAIARSVPPRRCAPRCGYQSELGGYSPTPARGCRAA
jgi:hypothetical protein